MLNQIIIQGRLTAAPDLRRTPNDVPVCSFTVAVDRDHKPNEDWEKQADFINCVAWRQTAEFVSRNFGKGGSIVVSGRMTSRRYTDKDGNGRYAYEIKVENVYFAGDSKREADSGSSQDADRAPSRDSFENARKPEFTEIPPDTEDPELLPF